MPITQFIAHEIQRADATQDAVLHPRNDELELNDAIERFVDDLKRSFTTRTSKRYGAFITGDETTDSTPSPLPAWINTYLENEQSFHRFSLQLTEHLVHKLNQIPAEFDGHLVLVEEQNNDMRWLFLFHVQHKPALLIDQQLDVIETEYADAAHLGFAARINLSQWQSQENDKFLSISRARGDKDLEALFIDCLGFIDTLDVKQQTDTFLAAVDTFAQQLPDEEAKACRSKVTSYCIEQDKAGEPVSYRELALQIDDKEPEQFESHLRNQNLSEDETLILDRAKLKKYSRFTGRNNEMAISFGADMLGTDVLYDPATQTLTLRKLPKSLLYQLKQAGAQD